MQRIKIFLASSQELKVSRDEFEKFIRRKNDSWASRDISLQLIIWEDFIDAVSQTRKQDDYNKAIRESDILLVLVFSKVGKYTNEEFETGYDQFQKTGRPFIYTYFQFPRIDEGNLTRAEVNSVFDFEEKLKQLDHFKNKFKSVEDLLLQFGEQLDKLFPYDIKQTGINKTTGLHRELTTIPKHDDEFIGREEDLKRLARELETSSKIVLMNGLGGIGKTTLAKKYVQDNLDKYDHVAWVEVKTQDTGHEQNMSISEAFGYDEVLSKSLNLEFTNESSELRFKLIIQALSNLPGKNLLVIDNAREDLNNHNIKDILPRPPHWNILVTSRNNFSGFKTLEIETLPEKQAKELFQAYYTKSADENDIKELLGEIGHHTLTIELLAKTLSYPGQKLSAKETLQKIRSKQLFSPDLQRKIELTHSKEETEIYVHLIQTFNLSPLTENEQWLMKQFCFLLPVSYTLEQIENFLDIDDQKKKEFHNSLYILSKKGWLQLNEGRYSIHRVVQQMTDYQLQPSLVDAEQLINKFKTLILKDAYTNVIRLFYLIPYGEFILSKLSAKETEDSLISELLNNMGIVIRHLGDYEKAKGLLELALHNEIKNFGENYPRVATTQSNLALVYQSLGNYEKARSLLEPAVANYIKNLGEYHPEVAKIQSNLATVYQGLSQYEKARDLLELALKNDIKNLGEYHPEVSIRQSNLATVYADMGEYEKAKNLLELAIKNDIKNLGEDHPEVSVRQSNLATVYLDMGDYEKAKELLELALKNDIKNFGEDNPIIAIRQSNLASAYKYLGEYEKSKELLEKAYKIRIRIFGGEHAKTKLIIEKIEGLKKYLKK